MCQFSFTTGDWGMADKSRYPQIPSTVWWGLRSILQKTPNATIDERLLGVQLGVQEAAARQYVTELKIVGLLTEENKATPLAQKWRLDETYSEAVQQLVQAIYPEGLVAVAPPGEADRQKIVSWFLREGLGQGSAGNKAATYLLLSSSTPNEAPARTAARSGDDNGKRSSAPKKPAQSKPAQPDQLASDASNGSAKPTGGTIHSSSKNDAHGMMPLNINVQIHISADAGSDQIETIFKAMRRYLYDGSNN
jgi:hypothetical protein